VTRPLLGRGPERAGGRRASGAPRFVALATVLALGAGGCGAGGGAARPELVAVPEPDLASAEAAVREQVTGARAAVERLAADPATPDGELAEAYGELGLVHVTYSFLDAAEAAVTNARSLAPEDARWPYLLGYLFEIQGRLDEAQEVLEAAVALAPGDLPSLVRLGRVRLERGEVDAAREAFERVLEVEPGNAAGLEGLGRVAAAEGDAARAVELFERVLEAQPSASSVRHALGLAYRRLGDLARAEAELDRGGDAPVLFVDPLLARTMELGRSAEIYRVRGAQAFAEERFDIAAEAYREAVEIDPDDFTTRKALGFSLQKLGDVDGAIEQLETALERGTSGDEERDRLERSEVHRILGGLLVLTGREDEGIEHFRAGLALDPDRADTRMKLANALARRGRFAEAIGHYDRLLELQADHAPTLVRRGSARLNLGRTQAGLADLERAAAAAPEDPEVRQRYAEALEFAGDAAGAARERAAAARLASGGERAELAAREGGRLLRAGDLGGAEAAYRRALVADPGLTDARYQLASILGHRGRLAEAIEEFDRVVEEAPFHGPARRGRATALMLMGRWTEARERLDADLREMPRDRALAQVFARLLAIAPDPRVRDGRRALAVARRVYEAGADPQAAETLAMAYAEAGFYDEAERLQSGVASAGGGGGLAGDRLERYRSGQPWRAGSPDEVFAVGG